MFYINNFNSYNYYLFVKDNQYYFSLIKIVTSALKIKQFRRYTVHLSEQSTWAMLGLIL